MNDIHGLKVALINYDMRTFYLFMRTMLSTFSDLKTVGSIIQTMFIKPEEQDSRVLQWSFSNDSLVQEGGRSMFKYTRVGLLDT